MKSVSSIRRPAGRTTLAVVGALALVASGCQSGGSGPGPLAFDSDQAALATMERVFVPAQACWFASRDPDFRPYRLANEMNSFTGRPRFLLVPSRNPSDRPLLVVQASGSPTKVEAFGPMMTQKIGHRIAADVKRWAGGSRSCGTRV